MSDKDEAKKYAIEADEAASALFAGVLNQPTTTPIKDIDEILSKYVWVAPDRRTYARLDDTDIKQELQTYIDNKILEARIDELEYVSSDIDGWLFTTADGKEQDVQDRIKELKSNQSKGTPND